MEVPYIITITVCSLFVLIFLIYLIVWSHKRNLYNQQMRDIRNMYSDKNLAKMDYDCAVYDAETEKLIAMQQHEAGQMTIDDVMKQSATSKVADKTVFQTVGTEGLEEITGNYNPDKNN